MTWVGASPVCATCRAASRARSRGTACRRSWGAEMSGFTAPHCGSLRAADEGRELELYGWVARRRDHGGVTFLDLRDRWGTVQVVIRSMPETHIRNEYVIHVTGKVARRP